MTNLLSEAKIQLEEIIRSALGACIADGTFPAKALPAFTVEIPSGAAHGDFACNAAMVFARAFQMPPRTIAEKIQRHLVLDGSYFETCEIAGPGFMNFFVSKTWFSDVLLGVCSDGENYGRSDFGQGRRVLVEFVSANPTGPMHIGNARGGAIGDCLTSVLEWAGYETAREFYVNDAGNQINKFAVSLEARYLQLYDPGVEMPEGAYLGEDIIAHAKNFNALHGAKYVEESEETRRNALVSYALPINIQGLKDDLKKYRIEYDNWFLESSLHNSGAVDAVIALLKQTGHTYESEGALWLSAEKFGADKDFVLVRANGVPTYVVPDIAYHYDKLVTRGFDRAINVLGADHHGYVPRLKAALLALGIDAARLDAVLMQMVRLVRGGEIIKASKRSGKAITLVTLLDEVPIDAARFIFNYREANTQMDFDLDLAVEKTAENPVYYVQYAHARICSILSKLKAEGIGLDDPQSADFSLLSAPEEQELIRHIALLPDEIIDAAKHYDPSRITRYIVSLATKFHKFYNACRVKNNDNALTKARLALCICVKTVLGNVLTLLRIDAPETM